jgi:hypothetical protein
VPVAERRELVRDGRLSALALRWPFSPLSALPPELTAAERTGVPVLDQERKSSGAPNFNHRAYVDISRRQFDDALWVLRHRPGAYAEGLRKGIARFFDSATDDPGFARNRPRIAGWDRIYERALVCFPALWLLALGYGAARAARRPLTAESATIAYTTLTALYVVVLWLATDSGETYRARVTLEPLVLAFLLPLALRRVLTSLRGAHVGPGYARNRPGSSSRLRGRGRARSPRSTRRVRPSRHPGEPDPPKSLREPEQRAR